MGSLRVGDLSVYEGRVVSESGSLFFVSFALLLLCLVSSPFTSVSAVRGPVAQ
jgi:hypothetical protein